MKIKLFILFIILSEMLTGSVSEKLVISSPPLKNTDQLITVLTVEKTRYLSAQDFAAAFGVRIYYRKESGKIVFFFKNNKIKLTVNNSFLMFDAQIFQMPLPAVLIDDQVFVPAVSFLTLVKQYTLPDLQYTISETTDSLYVNENRINHFDRPKTTGGTIAGITELTGIRFEEKANGVAIRINAPGTFTDADFSSFFKGEEWFYLTIYGASCDSSRLSSVFPTNSIQKVVAIPTGSSVQIGFQLNRQFKSADVHFDMRTSEILLSLFLPLNRDIKRKIEEAKTAWIIDTIVLDPGHGGKDPGTPGRWGYMHEKDIVLDVALRVGRLLEKNKKIKVVYTRKTDEFIPIWKRSEIANQANGKLFISLHVNATKNISNAEGLEFYLLRPGRSEEAIKIAETENSVIHLEDDEDKLKYQGYDDITNILANMVHSTNMKDSELLASIHSRNFTQMVAQKNRGVKQAGFYVLVGADMPKLLCELGYNTNKEEARKLNNPKHRQKMAEAIYKSIIEFKELSDKTISR
ncbi:MAG: N-acetylmuramoyl-L-alanine amidase [Candidatus Marinimicrobia bacterium]|nr:N-acetylmuramoyl-L-alanine amidase [Candidatus Neomarinimicrobiota bacterium]